MGNSDNQFVSGGKLGQSNPSHEVFRDVLKDGSPGPTMIWVSTGRFLMGDIRGSGWDNEGPVQEVAVERFAIGIYPLSFDEYDKFAEFTGREKPYDHGWGRGNRPVINISWLDALAYCNWLTQQTGETYRLPTEAEWEYVARAGTNTDYWWGNEIGINKANCIGSNSTWSGEQTSPVDAFEANPFGLYATVGNVWEWTCSKYENQYAGEEQHYFHQNPSTEKRSIRGGAWNSPANRARVSARAGGWPGYRSFGRGCRLASRTIPQYGVYPGWMP
jgi:formylglycine-generating enzyme required for sulfatase activity